MKNILKIPLLILLLLILNITFKSSSCHCRNYCFSITGMRLEGLNNAGKDTVGQKSGTIPARAFALVMELYTSKPGYCFNYSTQVISFMATATAECRPWYVCRDSIVLNKLYADHNFDPKHTIGKDLSDVFMVSPSPNLNFDLQYGTAKSHIYYLKSLPDSERTYRFIYYIKCKNGNVFTDTTQPIKLAL